MKNRTKHLIQSLKYAILAFNGGFFLLLVTPLFLWLIGEPFYIEVIARMTTFAIAALSLGLILGFGGMVSFGHAAFVGIGAYALGILSYHGVESGLYHFIAAATSSAVFSFIIGFLSLQTAGLYFIMITLAFSQMVYYLVISLNLYGGDFGINVSNPSSFVGKTITDPIEYYYVSLFVLIGFYYISSRIIRSRFGMVVQGAKSNETRMKAIGFPVFRYKLTAFVISGTMAGVSGALMANQAQFVSPDLIAWTRSGEMLIAVILGGAGSLAGPIVGSYLLLSLEEVLPLFTSHLGIILGPLLIFVVLFARGGVLGFFNKQR